MSSYKKIKNYVKQEKKVFLLYWGTILFILFYYSLIVEQEMMYPLVCSFIFFLLYCIPHYSKVQKRNELLEVLKIQGVDKNQMWVLDEEVSECLIEVHRLRSKEENEHRQRQKEQDLVVSQFVHQMKSSCAIIKMAVESQHQDQLLDIEEENEHLIQQLEQLLQLQRLEQFTNDYQPKKLSSLLIIQECIQDLRKEFIYKKNKPVIIGEDTPIFSDEKWLKYMLQQIISNSLKYSDEGSTIRFEIKQNRIDIIDEGWGIDEVDVGRVFELFYTGENGRKSKQATGIGLYVVKKIADDLHIDIEIQSKVTKGTTCSLQFLTKL